METLPLSPLGLTLMEINLDCLRLYFHYFFATVFCRYLLPRNVTSFLETRRFLSRCSEVNGLDFILCLLLPDLRGSCLNPIQYYWLLTISWWNSIRLACFIAISILGWCSKADNCKGNLNLSYYIIYVYGKLCSSTSKNIIS